MNELANILYLLFGTSIGGTLGYLLKTMIDHRLAIQRVYETVKATEKVKAVASFRAAFAPSLAFLYLARNHGSTHEAPDVDSYLKKSLPDIAAAIELFRPFVQESNAAAFQSAWEKFRYEVWNYGFDATSMRREIDDPLVVFEKLIESLLVFAKSKWD